MDRNKEVKDVIDAGNELLGLIKVARKELEGARSWGMIDILGGGFLSSAIKQSKITNGKNIMEKVQDKLEVFENELGDLDLEFYNISNVEKVFDIFFDNVFVDFFVQGKIKENLNYLYKLEIEVKDILNKLR